MRKCLIDGEIVFRASSIRSFDKCDKVSLIRNLSNSGRLKCPYCKSDVIFKYSFDSLFRPHFAHKSRKNSFSKCPYLSQESNFSSSSGYSNSKYVKSKPSNLVKFNMPCKCGHYEFLDTDIGYICHKCRDFKD